MLTLNCEIVCTGHGAIVSCLRQGNVIKCLWGKLSGTWERALVKARILLEELKSCRLIVKVYYQIRFRGVSQNLQANNLIVIQGTTNVLLVSKSVFIICAHLVANFPHHRTIQTPVALIFHVYHATSDTEIWMTFFSGWECSTKGCYKIRSCEMQKLNNSWFVCSALLR
jgi:hypothetical protein